MENLEENLISATKTRRLPQQSVPDRNKSSDNLNLQYKKEKHNCSFISTDVIENKGNCEVEIQSPQDKLTPINYKKLKQKNVDHQIVINKPNSGKKFTFNPQGRKEASCSYESYISEEFENQQQIGAIRYVPHNDNSSRRSRQYVSQKKCYITTIIITVVGSLFISLGLLTIVTIYIPIFGVKLNWEICGITGVIFPICNMIAIIISWLVLKKRLRMKKGIWKLHMEKPSLLRRKFLQSKKENKSF